MAWWHTLRKFRARRVGCFNDDLSLEKREKRKISGGFKGETGSTLTLEIWEDFKSVQDYRDVSVVKSGYCSLIAHGYCTHTHNTFPRHTHDLVFLKRLFSKEEISSGRN